MPYIPTENHLPKKDVGKFREWEFCRNSTHTLPHHHHHLRSPRSMTLTTQRHLMVTTHAVVTVHSKSIRVVPLFSFDTISRCHVAAPATWQRSFVFHDEQQRHKLATRDNKEGRRRRRGTTTPHNDNATQRQRGETTDDDDSENGEGQRKRTTTTAPTDNATQR
jgi:hypothetical protein